MRAPRQGRISRSLAAVVELCRIGRRELVGRVVNGTLSFAQLWTAAKGATRCIEEIAREGEAALVDDATAAARIEHGCEMCASRTCGEIARVIDPEGTAIMVRSWYCGPALEELPRAERPTCGCLVATEMVDAGEGGTLVRLDVLPACAALLKSKKCWQGKW